MFFLFIIPALLVCNFLSWRSQKHWITPVTLTTIGVFIPFLGYHLRWSTLQDIKVNLYLYVLIWMCFIGWVLLPTVRFRFLTPIWANNVRVAEVAGITRLHQKLARIMALLVPVGFLIGDYVQADTILLFRNPELAYQLHNEYPVGFQILMRSGPAVGPLLWVCYYRFRSPIDLAAICLVLVAPFSRLARLDVMMTFVTLFVANSLFPVFSLRSFRSKLMSLSFAAGLLLLGFSYTELGNTRVNRRGEFSFNYDDIIQYSGPTSPGSFLSHVYGYFCLTYENLNGMPCLQETFGAESFGRQSFSWFTEGILRMNRWAPDASLKPESLYTPVTEGSNTFPGIGVFIMDFGLVGSVLPIAFYGVAWMMLYERMRRGILWSMIYCTVCGQILLISFHPIPFSMTVLQNLVLLMLYYRAGSRYRIRNHQLSSGIQECVGDEVTAPSRLPL
jgi:hypothetical protein